MRKEIVKCFDKVTKYSEFAKYDREVVEKQMAFKLAELDCQPFFTTCKDRNTEKAWCFDLGKDWSTMATKRYVYAPKSVCKVLENDYYTDGEPVVLVPTWIIRKW